MRSDRLAVSAGGSSPGAASASRRLLVPHTTAFAFSPADTVFEYHGGMNILYILLVILVILAIIYFVKRV